VNTTATFHSIQRRFSFACLGLLSSDGVLDDTLDFHAGLMATVGLANWQGQLVI